MNVPRVPDSFEFADYLGVLRRQWWLVVVLVCVGVLAGSAYLKVAHKEYTATATVSVTATGVSQSQSGAVAGGRTTSTINLDTEAQLVQSTTVATIATHIFHTPLAPSVLVQDVSVTVPPNSSVLQISCTLRSAQNAAACANAFAVGYLQNRNSSASSAIAAQLNAIRTQQASLQKQAAQLTTQVNTLPTNSSQRGSAQTQLATVNGELTNLANQAASLTAASTYSGGTIISSATPPTKSSSPKLLLILPSALLAGLLIGLILAFAVDRKAKRISRARELERFGLPVLLNLSRKDLRAGPMASARSAAGFELAELARVTAATLGGDSQMLLVTDTSAGNGSAVVAANLAATLARTRAHVILVCPADQHTLEFLGLTDAPQLDPAAAAGLAAGIVSLAEVAVRPDGFTGLAVLLLDSDLDELHYELASELARRLRGYAQYVVIEAPASVTGADSFALAEFCDAALVTVEMSRTRRPEIEDRIRLLDRLGIRILGLAAVPRLRLAGSRSRAPVVTRPRGLGSLRSVPPAVASDRAGNPRAGKPTADRAANQKTMDMTAVAAAVKADEDRAAVTADEDATARTAGEDDEPTLLVRTADERRGD